jgi:U3 small nucleolar RNA-associated protein 22
VLEYCTLPQHSTPQYKMSPQQEDTYSSNAAAHPHPKHSLAADADFLSSHAGDNDIDLVAAVAAAESSSGVDGTAGTADDATTMTAATSELYRNNLMRMESQELLSESKLTLRLQPEHEHVHSKTSSKSVKWTGQAQRYLQDVQDAIRSLPATTFSPDLALFAASNSNKKDVAHASPCLLPLYSDKALKHVQGSRDAGSADASNNKSAWNINFEGGADASAIKLSVAGSAATGGMLKRVANAHVTPTIDLNVSITAASKFYHAKDYLNYRYFDKRNLLALHVAKTLQGSKKHRKTIGTVELSYCNGDTRRVVVLLTPPTTTSSKTSSSATSPFRVRLLFGTDGAVFPPARLLPDRNNVRPTYTNSGGGDGEDVDDVDMGQNNGNGAEVQTQALPATPHYNNALAEDSLRTTLMDDLQQDDNSSSMHSTLMEDSLVLIKVWATQRGHLAGTDTIGSFGLHCLITYLFRTKRVSPRQTPLQVFVALMKLLRDSNFTGTGVSHHSPNNPSSAAAAEGREETTISSNIGYKGLKLNCDKSKLHRLVLILPPGAKSKRQSRSSSNVSKQEQQQRQTDAVQIHRRHGCDVLFLESSLTLNLLGHMSASSMHELQHEARQSLDIIHGHGMVVADATAYTSSSLSAPSTSFRRLFLTSCRFWRKHDAYVHVPVSFSSHSSESANASASFVTHAKGNLHTSNKETVGLLWETRCRDMGRYEAACRSAVELVAAALGDRATMVRPLSCGNGELMNGSHVLPLGGVGTLNNGADSNQMTTWSPRPPSKDNSKELSHFPLFTSKPNGGCGSNDVANCPLAWQNGQLGIVLGIRIHSDTAARLVDRGPPADEKDSSDTKEFKAFWGRKAELRRFKDGAIVHAVVWDQQPSETMMTTSHQVPRFRSPEATNSIVEQIINYILQAHFPLATNVNVTPSIADAPKKKKKRKQITSNILPTPQHVKFLNRQMLALVESYETQGSNDSKAVSSVDLHKSVMSAYDNLTSFLLRRTKDDQEKRLGNIPMAINLVEPLGPALRYCQVFPPHPHPLLRQGQGSGSGSERQRQGKVAGAVMFEPIDIQLRLARCGNWPSDVNAMGAAKCAVLVLLANGLEQELKVKCDVCPTHMTVGYEGFLFRIYIRPDEELRLLKQLKHPTVDAISWKRDLEKRHVVAASHHALIHGIHTRHPSAGMTVRLAKRWCAAHLLSSQILPQEAIELLVAKIYSDALPFQVPAAAHGSGFLRFLHLLFTHDWNRQPLIVDSQGGHHLTNADLAQIHSDFELARGRGGSGAGADHKHKGPSMYIVSPNDRRDGEATQKGHRGGFFLPTFTQTHPEHVVLARAVALAKKSYYYLLSQMAASSPSGDGGSAASTSGEGLGFGAVFSESAASLKSFSVLLRIDKELVIDHGCSSTHGSFGGMSNEKDKDMRNPFTESLAVRVQGPKELRKKIYKNLVDSNLHDQVLVSEKMIVVQSHFCRVVRKHIRN